MWTENTVCYNWKFCCKFRHQRVCKAPRPIGIKGLESLRVSTAGGYSFQVLILKLQQHFGLVL